MRGSVACTLWVLARARDEGLRRLERVPAGVRVVVGDTPEAFDGQPRADVILVCSMGRELLRSVLPKAPTARWVHSRSVGVEGILFPGLVESGVTLTNGRGVFGPSLAEWVIGAVLFFAKDLRRLVKSQEAGRWDPFPPGMVEGRWMGIVGYGDIGRAVAARARSLGMRVRALRRNAAAPPGDPVPDEVLPPERLTDLMALSDDVVVATPLTPDTRGLIGDREIRAMKPTGVLVNVGRGAVVQEPPLIDALRARAIRGAALDVFETEPLPATSPLWSTPNLIVSPHIAGQVPDYVERAVALFLENLDLLERGMPPRTCVDRARRY
jgi:phosphoglycerate dehydrogenase-like enzyme